MKKKSTGWLIATVLWGLVLLLNLLSQNYDSFKMGDGILHGLNLAITLSCLFYFFKKRKEENANG